MAKDKKSLDEYPKMNESDKQLKQQDEFDSAGAQRQLEDDDKNASISEASSNQDEEK